MTLTKTIKTLIVSLLLVACLPAFAHASGSSMTIGCTDGSSEIAKSPNNSKHTLTITCKSGSKIDYLANDSATNVVKISCPGTESVGSTVDTPNQPTSKIVFYCNILSGGTSDPHATRTNHTPSAKISNAPVNDESCADGTQDQALCSPACQNSSDCNLTKTYINPFINKFLAPLAILSVIIGIIWGSIEYATSAGDAQRAASGKGKIQKALIGLIAFLFLFAFLQWLIPGGLI